jgi:hypothetical protein
VLKGLRELRVSIQVLRELKVGEAHKELKERLILLPQKDLKVSREKIVRHKVHKELRVAVDQALQGLKENKVLKDLVVKELRVLKENKVLKGLKDPKDLLQIKDIKEMLHH